MRVRRTTGLVALLAMLLWISTLTAADTSNNAVTVSEGKEYVTFSGKLLFTSGGTDNSFSQVIELASLDMTTAVLQLWADDVTNTDVNVFYQGSMVNTDTTFADGATRAALDDVDATFAAPVIDYVYIVGATVNTVLGPVEPAALCRYMRLKGDGQTGNPTTAVINFRLRVKKTVDRTLGSGLTFNVGT